MAGLMASLSLLLDHVGLAALAAVTFFVGAFSAVVVVRYNLNFLKVFPLWCLKQVTKVAGPNSHWLWLFAFIFGFNSLAMFVYMSCGLIMFLPTIVNFLTGMHLAIIFAASREVEAAMAESQANTPNPAWPSPTEVPSSTEPRPSPSSRSAVSEGVAAICGVLVIVLELPAFWFSIALGMSLSDLVWAEHSSQTVCAAYVPRATAYAQIIVPVLAVSAAAEAVAIKGLGAYSHRVTKGKPSDV